jgi:hypothetical protein
MPRGKKTPEWMKGWTPPNCGHQYNCTSHPQRCMGCANHRGRRDYFRPTTIPASGCVSMSSTDKPSDQDLPDVLKVAHTELYGACCKNKPDGRVKYLACPGCGQIRHKDSRCSCED